MRDSQTSSSDSDVNQKEEMSKRITGLSLRTEISIEALTEAPFGHGHFGVAVCFAAEAIGIRPVYVVFRQGCPTGL